MESPDLLPSVQCDTDCELEAFKSVLSIEELLSVQRQLSEDKMPSLSQALGGIESEGRAGLSEEIRIITSAGDVMPQISVITSSNTRKQGHSPSFEGWGSRPSRKAQPTIGASSNTHLPTIPTPYHVDLFSGIALHCTDFTANYSNNLKDRNNENNMQSVKISLVLDYIDNIECKGIVNDILISDISLILCVPKIIRQNYEPSCDLSKLRSNNIDIKNLVAAMADTNVLGAFPQTLENMSQKTVDNFCDSIIFLKRILINQIIGTVPYNSIPVFKNAITVQGMVYGHPHSNSFNSNLIFNVAVPDREPLNKSDYAFYDAIRIISNHSVFKESETVSTKIEYHNIDEQVKYYGEQYDNVKTCDQILMEKDASDVNRCEIELDTQKQNNDENAEEYETFANGDFTFSSLLKMVSKASSKIKTLLKNDHDEIGVNTWGLPQVFKLMGGGESSLNTTSGWGSPPNSGNNNGNTTGNWGNTGTNNQTAAANSAQNQQWGTAAQRPPGTQPDGNSNKVTNNTGNSNGAVGTSSGPGSGWGSGGPASTIPPSSQPSSAQQNPPPSQNGGNNSPGGNSNSGGPPIIPSSSGSAASSTAPASSTAKAQLEQLNTMRESLFSLDGWGGQHVNQDTNWDVPNSPEPGVKLDQQGGPPVWKPNANNGTDLWEANLRNGGQPPPQPVAKTPWGHTPTTNIGGTWGEDDDPPENSNVWTGPPPPQQWGGPPQQPPHWNAAGKKDDWGGWGEQHRPDMHRPDMHNRDLRAPAPDPRDLRAMMGMEGRGDMRGDPRGISGRLNGTTDMWGQHHVPHAMQPQNKMMPTNVGNGVNQWGAQGPKDIGMVKSGIGWDEPSPPTARRNMPSFDDGTSLWGQQRGGSAVALGPWKDIPGGMGRGTMQCPPGMPPNRMPSVAPNQMKPEGMWGGHPHRNGAWDENSSHSANWDKEGMPWNEGPMNQSGWTGPKSKPMGGPAGSWDADMGDWCGPKPPVAGPPGKNIPKDVIWNSKQFRLLADMGYKKDDIELALRSRDMNVDEAMDLLSQMRGTTGIDTWRRHEDHPGPPFDHQQQYPAPPRPHHAGFPPQQPPTVPFPQPGQGINSINNISPALVQKILNQPSSQPPPPFNQQNNQSGGEQPRTQQLRMLVQQIQMAVQAGYLNNQILNQPLAPQTLVLLNQLLQQIKILQQLGTQLTAVSKSMTNPNSSQAAYHQAGITVEITKTKQQITNLQNQIAAQQGIYVKQQARNAGGSGASSTTGDFFNKGHDPINQMQNTFAELGINKEQPAAYNSGQQSRLNQWKLPSLDKESEGSEFSRAPGTTAKAITSPQLNPLGLQNDNTWSSGRSVSDGWPSSDNSDLPDGKESWPSAQPSQGSSTYTDLVPEFEPGKPWKGNQMKSIEDDPAITPGSVARSPLSLAAIKDTDLFGSTNQGKSSPTTPSERSLSSSTWSYPPPPVSTPSSFNIPKTAAAKTSWGDTPTTSSSALWGSSSSKSRGPPPGLATSKSGSSWTNTSGSTQAQRPSSFTQQQNWQSTWLLLKNLTAQIDGSTLKTLCMQHGPLLNFHLYLNQGIALAKYSTREEANKAQTALNNCVLGNTTIFAESPGDSDVDMILQHLSQGGGSGQWRGNGNGSSKTNPTGTSGSTSSESWPFPSMWGDNLSEQRATPSNLSSYLPNDLLSSESM